MTPVLAMRSVVLLALALAAACGTDRGNEAPDDTPADSTNASVGTPPVPDRGTPLDRLGQVRLGMTGEEVGGVVAARDTAWEQEGMPQAGMLVMPDGGGRALAVLDQDRVVRIEVRDSVLRTPQGVGVGSTVASLRARFGRNCAAVGEGVVVIWFPEAPGISFAVNVPMSDAMEVIADPGFIPDTAEVTRWWIRQGTDDCPAPAVAEDSAVSP